MNSEQTKDKVFKACDELHSNGEKITVRLLLTMIDEINSTSTVHKYYSMWRDQLEANQNKLYEQLGFSTQFTQMFMTEISRFSAEAERRYKESAQSALEARNEAIEDLTRTEDKYQKQVALVESLEEKLNDQIAFIASLKNEHQAAKNELQSNANTLEKELREQIKELESKLSETRANNEQLRTELAKSEVKLEQNQALVDQVKLNEDELRLENEKLKKTATELSTQLATAKGNEAAALDAKRVKEELYVELKTRTAELEQSLKQSRDKEDKLIRVQSELESSNVIIEQLRENMRVATQQVSQSLEAKLDAETEATEKSKEIARFEAELKEVKQNLTGQLNQVATLTELNKQLSERLKSFEAQN